MQPHRFSTRIKARSKGIESPVFLLLWHRRIGCQLAPFRVPVSTVGFTDIVVEISGGSDAFFYQLGYVSGPAHLAGGGGQVEVEEQVRGSFLAGAAPAPG